MSPTDSTEVLILLYAIALQANVPAMLWGPPGVAKTAITRAIARALGWPCITKLVSQHDPTDFGGYPNPTLGGTTLTPLKWVVDLSEQMIGAARAIVFLDEINMGARTTQGAAMQLILEGKCGEGELGPGVARAAAGNPPETSGNTSVFEPAMANRFFHLDWVLTASYWIAGMASGFEDPSIPTLPADWEKGIPLERDSISAYIMHNSTDLHVQPDDDNLAGRAWPTGRTWEMAARLLAAGTALGVNDGIKSRLVAGSVGQTAASTYMAYRRTLDLPNVEDALKHPDKIKWPNRGDRVYAFLGSLVNAIADNNTKARYAQAWEVISLAEMKDVAAMSAKRLAKLKQAGYPLPVKAAAKFFPAMNMAGMAKAKVATTT